ncbi:MAG: polysaccharide deacetylase family protein [Ahrensia sp.]|nr:polysaccharide deacetylase family protein [Ahrensia sp.]
MRITRVSLAVAVCLLSSSFAALAAPEASTEPVLDAASQCRPGALGTARIIEINAEDFPRIVQGTEETLGLGPKEVILTFDDGPIARKTPKILDALKKECVKATFFYVGRMARAYPDLVRRVVAEGHIIGHHTWAHNWLTKYGKRRAGQLIDKGVAEVEKIAYGSFDGKPRVPFMRFPYLASNKGVRRITRDRGFVAFGANIDAQDWKRSSANRVHNRIMKRLRRQGRGIILMHDIQNRTAKMLPRLLRTLKKEGYKIVHMVPRGYDGTPVPQVPVLVAATTTLPKYRPVGPLASIRSLDEAKSAFEFDLLRTDSAGLNSAKGSKQVRPSAIVAAARDVSPPPAQSDSIVALTPDLQTDEDGVVRVREVSKSMIVLGAPEGEAKQVASEERRDADYEGLITSQWELRSSY